MIEACDKELKASIWPPNTPDPKRRVKSNKYSLIKVKVLIMKSLFVNGKWLMLMLCLWWCYVSLSVLLTRANGLYGLCQSRNLYLHLYGISCLWIRWRVTWFLCICSFILKNIHSLRIMLYFPYCVHTHENGILADHSAAIWSHTECNTWIHRFHNVME